jgi:hypothetical protein
VEPMPLLWCIMVFLYGRFGDRCNLDKTREQNFRQWRGMSLQATWRMVLTNILQATII